MSETPQDVCKERDAWKERAWKQQARAEKAEAALREARWLAEHWPAFWIVGPRWTDAERYAKAIEAIKALRDTAPRRSSHDA